MGDGRYDMAIKDYPTNVKFLRDIDHIHVPIDRNAVEFQGYQILSFKRLGNIGSIETILTARPS